MKDLKKEQRKNAKQSIFPVSLFGVIFIVLLLMCGIHTGLIVLMNQLEWSGVAQTILPMIYWAVIAIGLTVYTSVQIRKTYEVPMRRLAKATADVAAGDFSVYIPPRHTADKLDYLDIMFMDFNTMVEELGSIETLKNDFAANVSHELKTPLTVIQNYAQLLQTTELTPQQQEYVASIEGGTQRLSSLIFNMLKLNKLESQKITPKAQAYDLCRQLENCILGFESIWEKKKIEIDVDMEEMAMVEADEEIMEMVWQNLLSNAFKFTEEGGIVSLKQYSDEEMITVEVADTGCGMAPDVMKRIFDKFYQGDTSHATEGNGLGLALVWRILQMSGGSITVNSEEGKGSTFTVRLPKKVETEEVQ
ncbi:sensor histidine kinase [Anaerotignum sp.]|nr:HAMP domain-containing sensor histidine kinase [Anaerotignum sp.]